jgi:hypothetical protein
MMVDIPCFFKGIVLQGVACFGKFYGAANVPKGYDFDEPLQGSGYFFDFFSVVGGETDFHIVGLEPQKWGLGSAAANLLSNSCFGIG